MPGSHRIGIRHDMYRLWIAGRLTLLLLFITACGEVQAPLSAEPSHVTRTATSRLASTTQPVEATTTRVPPTSAPPTSLPATPTAEPVASSTATTRAANADLPALEPANAPPTPFGVEKLGATPSEPARIMIPAIGLDLVPVAVGLDERRVPIVPQHDVGWFTESAKPGERSNVIFWGHVLRWKDSPKMAAPFERMHELQPGAEMTVVTVDGMERRYRVTEQIQTKPEETQLLYPTLSERLTFVSCIGDRVIQQGTITKEFRLVTIAEPAQ